ncbi:hypothetical protein, partial [Porphyromonas loveana]|uniref:hypothetical protein n=1 Tax=Porphyromonas loveana TaxID=1884669 RepID=UPI0035A0F157
TPCKKTCRCVMFSLQCVLLKKHTPKKIYFGAISGKIMRQINFVLARVSQPFWRRILRDFSL